MGYTVPLMRLRTLPGTGEKTATLLTVTRPLVRTVKTVIDGQMKGSQDI